MDSDTTRARLEHAAKLASVGELAAGIAHEINNPLAVISEEAGLMADFLNPQLSERPSDSVLVRHLDSIQEAVFRCRDITRRLLRFVRKTEVDLRPHNIHALIDAVVAALGAEWFSGHDRPVRPYHLSLQTDATNSQIAGQRPQTPSTLGDQRHDAITTSAAERQVRVACRYVRMTPEQMEQLFVRSLRPRGRREPAQPVSQF
jgi:signal transduction histidine kinase